MKDFLAGVVVGAMLAILMLALAVAPQALQSPEPEPQPLAIQSAAPPAITRVIDGDTVCVDVQLIDDIWLHNAPMRLQGINCPEMNTVEGIAAREFAANWIAGHDCRIVLAKKRDKYGRLLGDVAAGDQLRLTDELLLSGHAKKVSY